MCLLLQATIQPDFSPLFCPRFGRKARVWARVCINTSLFAWRVLRPSRRRGADTRFLRKQVDLPAPSGRISFQAPAILLETWVATGGSTCSKELEPHPPNVRAWSRVCRPAKSLGA